MTNSGGGYSGARILGQLSSTCRSGLAARIKNYPYYLAVLALVLFFTELGRRDLWAPVEPRYAEIVRVMFVNNEWVVPRVNGELYTDKPILYFWLAHLFSNLAGGVSEWTVRLPAALGGIGFVLATYFIGRDFFGARVGLIAAAVLASSMRVIWEARWAHIDMLFGFLFVLTVYFGARSLFGKAQKREILWAYVFMGLAALAKGLIGIVLPALLLGAFAIIRRDWRILAAANLPMGIPIFILVVAPWTYLVNNATDGKWLTDFIYVHHLQRYTDGMGHREPFYYYLTTLPADFLPWTIFVIPALWAYCSHRRLTERPVAMFFLLWFIVVFLFFSISDTKRDLYLLPLMPTLALLVGNYIDDMARKRLLASTLYMWLSQLFFSAVAIVGLAAPISAWAVRQEMFWISLPAALGLSVGGILTVLFIREHRPLKVLAAVTLLMTFTIVSIAVFILPYLDQFKSHRPLSLQIKKILPPSASLYVYADSMHDFNFYTERDIIPVLSSPDEVTNVLRQEGDSYLLIKERDLKTLGIFSPEEALITNTAGSKTWNLIALKQR